MKINKKYTQEGFTMRLSQSEDFENYYEGNFNPVSDDVARFTGCQKFFEREKVEKFFYSCIEDQTRVDFVVLNSEGKIVAEVVLNNIEEDVRQANFRICVFKENESGKGLGSWMIQNILDYGFTILDLNRIYLDVFSFNDRAFHLYKKSGFVQEGILRQSILDKEELADDILMSILKEEWLVLY